MLGGYLAARIAKAHHYVNAMVIGVMGIIIGILGAIAAGGEYPLWSFVIGFLLVLPAALLGGRLAATASHANAVNQPEPPRKRSPLKKALLIAGLSTGALAAAALIAGGIWVGTKPEPGVKLNNQMDAYALDYLGRNNILNASEKLIAYYDATLRMNGTEAAILTTERVLYHRGGSTHGISLGSIEDVQHSRQSMIGDVIEVYAVGGDSMTIQVLPWDGGETFLRALVRGWHEATAE
jgi:hypothetical protein